MPTVYAELLGQKIDEHGVKVYLVNTGWSGGSYGVGKRMSIQNTRACVNAILSGEILKNDFDILPTFSLLIPQSLEGVDTEVLNPRNTWEDKQAYDDTADKLAGMFIENFKKYLKNGNTFDYTMAGPSLN
jgi:phosphoenolpyruvate carboxykinase (ATP)